MDGQSCSSPFWPSKARKWEKTKYRKQTVQGRAGWSSIALKNKNIGATEQENVTEVEEVRDEARIFPLHSWPSKLDKS